MKSLTEGFVFFTILIADTPQIQRFQPLQPPQPLPAFKWNFQNPINLGNPLPNPQVNYLPPNTYYTQNTNYPNTKYIPPSINYAPQNIKYAPQYPHTHSKPPPPKPSPPKTSPPKYTPPKPSPPKPSPPKPTPKNDPNQIEYPEWHEIRMEINREGFNNLQKIIDIVKDSKNRCNEKERYLNGIIEMMRLKSGHYKNRIAGFNSVKKRIQQWLKLDELRLKHLKTKKSDVGKNKKIWIKNSQKYSKKKKSPATDKKIRDIIWLELPKLEVQILELEKSIGRITGFIDNNIDVNWMIPKKKKKQQELKKVKAQRDKLLNIVNASVQKANKYYAENYQWGSLTNYGDQLQSKIESKIFFLSSIIDSKKSTIKLLDERAKALRKLESNINKNIENIEDTIQAINRNCKNSSPRNNKISEYPQWSTIHNYIKQQKFKKILSYFDKFRRSKNRCDEKNRYLKGIVVNIAIYLNTVRRSQYLLKDEQLWLRRWIKFDQDSIKVIQKKIQLFQKGVHKNTVNAVRNTVTSLEQDIKELELTKLRKQKDQLQKKKDQAFVVGNSGRANTKSAAIKYKKYLIQLNAKIHLIIQRQAVENYLKNKLGSLKNGIKNLKGTKGIKEDIPWFKREIKSLKKNIDQMRKQFDNNSKELSKLKKLKEVYTRNRNYFAKRLYDTLQSCRLK